MRCALRACAGSGVPRSLSHSLGLTLRLAHRSLTHSLSPTLAHWFPYTPPQRATPARKGARCGTGAGSPRPHRPHPGHTGRGTLTTRSRGRAAGGGTAPDTRPPHNRGRHPHLGRPSATPTASNAGLQGRTLWGRCWVPTPASTAAGTHGSRNPACPLQRTGGRGGDSA